MFENQENLRIWHAVMQKESEMKIEQSRMDDQIRDFDLKTKLMDLRIETAFKLRNDYVQKIVQKYPNFKQNTLQYKPRNSGQSDSSKTEIKLAEIVDRDMLKEWSNFGSQITLEKIIENKVRNLANRPMHDVSENLQAQEEIRTEIVRMKEILGEISLFLKEILQEKNLNQKSYFYPKNDKSSKEQEQAKTVLSITRRQSFRDKEYSATEHISLPPAEPKKNFSQNAASSGYRADSARNLDDQKKFEIEPIKIQAEKLKREKTEPKVEIERKSPKFSQPRFDFSQIPENFQNSEKQTTNKENDAPHIQKSEKTVDNALKTQKSDVQSPVQKVEFFQPILPAETSKPRVENQPDMPKKDGSEKAQKFQEFTSSSSSDSTPVLEKSSKMQKNYEILLGTAKDSSGAKKLDSSDGLSNTSDENDTKLQNFYDKKSDKDDNNTKKEAPESKAKIEEPLSDPDDFLAKLFPEKFSSVGQTGKSLGEKIQKIAKPGASLFGDRKPKKSAFFNMGDETDSESIEIAKKKSSTADDFDFFS